MLKLRLATTVNLAAVELKRERFAKALELANQALEIEPTHAKALFRKGLVRTRVCLWAGTGREREKGGGVGCLFTRERPSLALALQAYKGLKNWDSAVLAFSDALDAAPSDAAVRSELVHAKRMERDASAASSAALGSKMRAAFASPASGAAAASGPPPAKAVAASMSDS